MLKANVPIWLYWGTAPNILQPLNPNALCYAPRSHPQCCAPPLPVITPSQSVGLSTPSQSVSLRLGQLPGKHWKDFLARQNIRRMTKLSNKTKIQCQAQEGRENSAAKRSCPGKRGPTVYLWVKDNGVWN